MTEPREVKRLVEESRDRFHSVLELASEGDRLSRTFFPFTHHRRPRLLKAPLCRRRLHGRYGTQHQRGCRTV
jgi:hypothetical protein